jgi:hypothetical protein
MPDAVQKIWLRAETQWVIEGSPVGETHQPKTMPIDVECPVLFKKDGLRFQNTSHQPKLSRNSIAE